MAKEVSAKEMVVAPVVLEGPHVRLEPLQKAHLPGLAAVGLDEELWRWIPTPVRTSEEMATCIETALLEQERGVVLPFALLERSTGRLQALDVRETRAPDCIGG